MNITIPPEALEAGARAIHDMRYGTHLYSADDMARACFLAMVKAWPMMHVHEWQRPWLGGMSGTDLILPLTEKPDGE